MLQLHLSDQQFYVPIKACLILQVWRYISNTVRCHYNRPFSHKFAQKTPHSSPVRARYGVSVMGLNYTQLTQQSGQPAALCSMGYPSKCILNSNLAKIRLPITGFAVAQSFWNYAQSTTVILPCSVQNFKMIGQLKRMLWMDEILRDLSFKTSFRRIIFIAQPPRCAGCWMIRSRLTPVRRTYVVWRLYADRGSAYVDRVSI